MSLWDGVRLNDTKLIEDARKLIDKAERIYFVGFGYDQTNLKSLGLDVISKCTRVWWTSYRLPVAQQTAINRLFGKRVIQFFEPEIKAYRFMMEEFNPI